MDEPRTPVSEPHPSKICVRLLGRPLLLHHGSPCRFHSACDQLGRRVVAEPRRSVRTPLTATGFQPCVGHVAVPGRLVGATLFRQFVIREIAVFLVEVCSTFIYLASVCRDYRCRRNLVALRRRRRRIPAHQPQLQVCDRAVAGDPVRFYLAVDISISNAPVAAPRL